jgi:hypothetical protein
MNDLEMKGFGTGYGLTGVLYWNLSAGTEKSKEKYTMSVSKLRTRIWPRDPTEQIYLDEQRLYLYSFSKN